VALVGRDLVEDAVDVLLEVLDLVGAEDGGQEHEALTLEVLDVGRSVLLAELQVTGLARDHGQSLAARPEVRSLPWLPHLRSPPEPLSTRCSTATTTTTRRRTRSPATSTRRCSPAVCSGSRW